MSLKIPKHIFIVHNREINSVILDYILSTDRIYRFLSFNSAEECLENLYLNPDVIILDYELPGMNGYNTILKIKKHTPPVHLVILINQRDRKLTTELIHSGATDCILKEGHGEIQIIEKIDDLLTRDKGEARKRSLVEKLFFSVFVTITIALAVIYANSR